MENDNSQFLITKSSYLAHEMKNLLAICNLYSEIMEKQIDKVKFQDQKTEASFKNAMMCIDRALKMTDNLLLDFRSMKDNQIEKCDLNKILDSALEMSKIYAQDKKIELTNCNKLNVNIYADENKILSVLINIVKNAIESIEETGEVLISTNEYNNNIKIRISNTGKPISKKLQEQIFEEGFTTKRTGNGLGLGICKQTLETMNSDLQLVKSDSDSTDFEITVPKC
ncbi:HAMP domain-containing histidine kinase [bacterium]|nr:HAMP domain-containing histidine kinase [bacterium]